MEISVYGNIRNIRNIRNKQKNDNFLYLSILDKYNE